MNCRLKKIRRNGNGHYKTKQNIRSIVQLQTRQICILKTPLEKADFQDKLNTAM